MPPKIDPYVAPRNRIFDVLLILFAIIAIAIAIYTAPRHQSGIGLPASSVTGSAPITLASSADLSLPTASTNNQ